MKNKEIVPERLKRDAEILIKMEKLAEEGERDTEEYKDLFREYYVDNDDIRIYWKTY